jgi:two-component system, NarL family, sensor kinase
VWAADDKTLTLEVRDQGKGISAQNALSQNSGANHGVGLSGMRERLRELGGTLDIRSTGEGTIVTAALPATSARNRRRVSKILDAKILVTPAIEGSCPFKSF